MIYLCILVHACSVGCCLVYLLFPVYPVWVLPCPVMSCLVVLLNIIIWVYILVCVFLFLPRVCAPWQNASCRELFIIYKVNNMHINSLLINIIESLWLLVRHANVKVNQTGRKKSGYFMLNCLMKRIQSKKFGVATCKTRKDSWEYMCVQINTACF